MLPTLDRVSQAFVASMDQISQRMSHAQRQISTGLRVTNVSDEPDSISTLLQARANLASTIQIQTNLGRAKSEADAGEQALQNAVRLLEKARVLGSQGLTGTATAESRAALADEVASIMEEVVGLTGTTVEGRNIFSGDADQTPPYSIDLTATPPVTAYAGAAATREIQHPNGTRFKVGQTAQELFDSTDPTKNVLTSLQNLRTALAGDPSGMSAAVSGIASSLEHLNGKLAYYGSVQNKIADATSFGNQLKLQLQVHLSSIEGADLTEAILELSQAQLQQSAALQAQAKVPRTSLFDYLR
jgi:flagellar hook-associated protein 3 FlgL